MSRTEPNASPPPPDGGRWRARPSVAALAPVVLVTLLGGACGTGIGIAPRPLLEVAGLRAASPHLVPVPEARLSSHSRGRRAEDAPLPTPATVLDEAQQALRNGRLAAELGESDAATAWYLWAAARSWDVLTAEPTTAATARVLYGRAVGRYLELAFDSAAGLENRYAATTEGSVVVRIDRDGSDLDPAGLGELLDAGNLKVRGLAERHSRPGIGAPLVTVRRRSAGILDRFLPEAGHVAPATAVLAFDAVSAERSTRTARLVLLDPRRRRRTDVRGVELPLAADFTAPLAYLAEQIDPSPGLLRPDRVFSRKGLYLLEPYAPDKVPVLMIHGLRSSPLVWMDLTNDLLADDTLRQTYQVWHFSYPTGLPFLYAAFVLRDQLEELRHALLLETGEDLYQNPAVVLGHSMGGLVAKALAVDSHDALWRTVFAAAPSELEGSPHDLELARRTLVLEPSPLVARIVYLATPHHGSGLADSLVGRLGSTLAGRPRELAEAWQRLAELNAPRIADELVRQLRRGGPTSIRALSPRDPLLEAFSRLRPPRRVPYHSVIGTAGGDPTAPESDGVVSYRSAHLPGAESEAVLPSGHSIYRDPRAIDEVVRILERHLLRDGCNEAAETQLAGLTDLSIGP